MSKVNGLWMDWFDSLSEEEQQEYEDRNIEPQHD